MGVVREDEAWSETVQNVAAYLLQLLVCGDTGLDNYLFFHSYAHTFF